MKYNYKNILKRIWPYLLSVVLLIILFKFVGNLDLSLIKEVSIKTIIIAFIFYIIIKILNTIRFSYIYKKLNFRELLPSLLVCNFLLSLFPLRAGEISYLVYLKKIYKKDNIINLKNLLVVRFLDILSILILFIVSAIFVVNKLNNNYVDAIYYLAILLATIIIILFIIKKQISNIIIKVIRKIKPKRKYAIKLKRNIGSLANAFKEDSYKKLLITLFLSLAYWATRYIFGYVILTSLGLNLDIYTIFFITSITILIAIIPIQTIAGFGLHEISWTYLLVLFGIPKALAFSVSLISHIIIIIPILFLGIISWLYMLLRNNHKP